MCNVAPGYGAEAGAALSEHPTVRKLVFTGSVATGRRIMRAAAERLLPLTLELGGKSQAREEIFGPVLSVLKFSSDEEAIELANDSDYGFSRAHRVAAALEVGQVFINHYFAGGVETPFGAYKMSGIGKEKGFEAMKHYCQLKSVTTKI